MKQNVSTLITASPEDIYNGVRNIVKEELENASMQQVKEVDTNANKIYTREQAADYLKMNKNTLSKKCKEGKIEFSKKGHYLFTKKMLDNYIQNNQ